MLKQIKISGYKSLTDVEVALQPLSVLFGPNGGARAISSTPCSFFPKSIPAMVISFYRHGLSKGYIYGGTWKNWRKLRKRWGVRHD